LFASPLVVEAGTPVMVDIVEDMIHTAFANVTGGGSSWFPSRRAARRMRPANVSGRLRSRRAAAEAKGCTPPGGGSGA